MIPREKLKVQQVIVKTYLFRHFKTKSRSVADVYLFAKLLLVSM